MKITISIHALVKRATERRFHFCGCRNISIHALVKRATTLVLSVGRTLQISIHALVKRATFCRWNMTQNRGNFNPRPREEGDLDMLTLVLSVGNFNPRPREEGDVSTYQSILR